MQRVVAPMQGLLPVERFSLRALEEIRLILRGGSVIDWRRLNFKDRGEIDTFLRTCLFDCQRAGDREKLRQILADSVEYLRSVYRYRVNEVVASPAEIHDILLIASGVGPHRKFRRIACIVLKVMHTIFHTEARELLFRTPISEKDIGGLVDLRVQACASRMLADGLPIREFVGNVKARESVITKLLAKKETLAAQIFDKVRYRVVTERYEHILPVLHHLATNLFPFNFVLPGQTQNTLFSFKRLVEQTPELARLIPKLQHDHLHEERELTEMRRRPGAVNEFSGSTYRVLNFIADVPVRLDDYLCTLVGAEHAPPASAQIVFQPVEFQLMDEATARENEEGENSHEVYKRRQRSKVLRRLSRGLVVPKRGGEGGDAEAAEAEPELEPEPEPGGD